MARAKVDLYPRLDGQVALVSGANRGLVAVIAAGLADKGAFVWARDPSSVPAARSPHPVALNVTSESSIRDAMAAVRGRSKRLDILVNSAGVALGWGHTMLEEPTRDLDETFAVNLRGPVLLTRYALPLLLARPGGRVVNVSSGAGQFTEGMEGGSPAYSISKVGLNGLTAYLHGEFSRSGLLANAICPGWVRTQMGGSGADRSPEEGADTALWLAQFAPGSPAGLFWRDRQVIAW
jgi:hypothetical protein